MPKQKRPIKAKAAENKPADDRTCPPAKRPSRRSSPTASRPSTRCPASTTTICSTLPPGRRTARSFTRGMNRAPAYMALGAALATGKPQAYAVVPGPGLLNSGAALLTAYGMNAPVLALIGQIPAAAIGTGPRPSARNPRSGRHHRAAGRSLRSHSTDPAEAPAKIAKAIASMQRRPAGPGGAGMRHRRVGQARPGRADRRACAAARAAHRRGCRAQGGKTSRQAKRVLIVAGGGAQDASPEVTLLSRDAAGARVGLSARPRRARRPRSVQRRRCRSAATLGRSRRRARQSARACSIR